MEDGLEHYIVHTTLVRYMRCFLLFWKVATPFTLQKGPIGKTKHQKSHRLAYNL